MREIFKRIALAAALVAMLAPSAMAGGKLLLGVAGAHSGDLASYGLPTVNAAKLVADKINAEGGVLGMTVEIVAQDDQCKPELGTNVATKLLSDGVKIVIGHICSGATKAALPIYLDSEMVLMSPSATNPPLTQSGEYPNFFRTIAPDDAQASLEVSLAKKLGLKKLAVIHDKGDYGKGFAEFCKQFIEMDPSLEVALFEGVTPGAVDYSALIQKVKSVNADAVIFGGYHPEASKIVMALRREGLTMPFLSDDGVKDDTFIKVAGQYAEGVYATGPKDFSKNPVYLEAVEAHKKAFGADPGAFFPEAYSAALALLKAVEVAGGTDYAKVCEALRNTYVDTAVGKIKFDAKGDAEGVGFSIYQVQNGKYVEVK